MYIGTKREVSIEEVNEVFSEEERSVVDDVVVIGVGNVDGDSNGVVDVDEVVEVDGVENLDGTVGCKEEMVFAFDCGVDGRGGDIVV